MPTEDKSKWLLEREAFEEKALNWVKYCFKDNPSEIFDLHNHDKEVAIAFGEWVDTNAVRCGQLNWTVGAGYETKYFTSDELFEYYCTNPKQ